jgi:hypothetical protein
MKSLSLARVALAWLLAIGVDLLLHAGVFAGLFDSSRERALLPEAILFRRIPFAYAGLLVGVVALAWMLDRVGDPKRSGVWVGAGAGLAVGILGIGGLWTAIDITGPLVLAGIFVLVTQGAAAAAVLSSKLKTGRLAARVGVAFVAFVVIGQVAANLIG